CTVDYDVTVPEGTNLDLKTISGQVTVSNVHGELAVNTTSGSVQVSDHVGDLTVQTVSGNTDLEGIKGTVHTDSTSGNLTATGEGGLLNASSVSGNLGLSGFDAKALEADSTSGEISVGASFDTAEREPVARGVVVEAPAYCAVPSASSTSCKVSARVPPKPYLLVLDCNSGAAGLGVATSSESKGASVVCTVSGSLSVSPLCSR